MGRFEIFNKSKRIWGLSTQILMLVEELNELSVSALHLIHSKPTRLQALEGFAEEIADVEFMIEEMKYYFKIEETIAKYREVKEKRLERKLIKYVDFEEKRLI